MHPYYKACTDCYRKEISNLLIYIKPELKTVFSQDPDSVIRQVQDAFINELLTDMPYVGGKKNSNDTSNLISCCEFAAVFILGKQNGIENEQIGLLINTAWKKKHKKVSQKTGKILQHLLGKSPVHIFLRSFSDKSMRMSEEYEYAWRFEYEKPDEEYSVKIKCTRCGACRFLNEKGLADIMPYVCNIDFETAAAFGIPYYRNKVIAYGDECCANLVKRSAPVVTDNFPPHGLRKDGLK